MEGDDRELFERSIRHAVEVHDGSALDAALGALGWYEAVPEDPRAAVSFLFELEGRANATHSTHAALLATTLGLEAHPPVGFVLPALGSWRAPGEIVDGGLSVRGLGYATLADRTTTTLVTTRSGQDDRMVNVATTDLGLRPVEGVDPDLGLVQVIGDSVAFTAGRDVAPGDWSRAITRGRLAVGHELVGAAKAILGLARDHALERIQFGQPIGRFLAVRHRLADTLVAIETADAALDAAWEEQSPQVAAMAKALAGRGARTAARHGQQVLAGIGFTTEHPFHRHFRRILVLDQMLGAGRSLTRDLGDELLGTRRLPSLPPL